MAASFPLGTTFLSQGVCHSHYHRTQAWPWQRLVSSKASEDGEKEREGVCRESKKEGVSKREVSFPFDLPL